MFSKLPISNIIGDVIEHIKENISDHVSEITDGVVNLDSILKGQIKIDGNNYIDRVLAQLTEKMEAKELDSFNLPSQNFDFEKPIACGILLPGQAFMNNGVLSGLASFCRFDETVVKIDALGDPLISTRVAIGVKKAAIDYLVKLTVLCFEDDVAVKGSLDDIQVTMGLKISRSFEVLLDKFDVHSSGDLNLDFKNLGIFDSLADTIFGDLEQTIKEEVKKHIIKRVKDLTNEIIQNLPLEA